MQCLYKCHVTPLAGVWIEIFPQVRDSKREFVTPLAGVWIEISGMMLVKCNQPLSLPLRECGLKYLCILHILCILYVTPLAGVWIEIVLL